jgi:outer membrane receptor for Fe3+-dicitrate
MTFIIKPKSTFMKRIYSFLSKKVATLMITFLGLLISGNILAQSAVSGKVTDKKGAPLAGVSIIVKSTNVGTNTAANGTFTITALQNDVLVLSYVGFSNKEIVANQIGNKSIVLDEASATNLDEVVIIGYGTQKKKDLTGAISSVNIAETKKYSTSDISQLLQGRATGVTVTSDGQPGSVPSVRIRGFSTFGGAEPFYVVDGIPGVPIRDISPNEMHLPLLFMGLLLQMA